MDTFIPQSPDPFLQKDADMSPAKFGHINAIVEALTVVENSVLPGGNLTVATLIANDVIASTGLSAYSVTNPPVQQALATAADTTVGTLSTPGVATYTIVFTNGGVGFTDADTALTLVQVVRNLQDRVNELEAALQAYGLLA
jgi:hypothetical protein